MKKELEISIKTLIVAFISAEMLFDSAYGEGDKAIDDLVEDAGHVLFEKIVDHFKAQISMVTLAGDSCTITIPNNLIYKTSEIQFMLANSIHTSTPTYTLLDIVALGEK